MEPAALEAMLQLSDTYAIAAREIDAPLAGHHGLSFAELRLLRALAAAPTGRAGPTELARALQLTASGVSRALAPLVRRHIVEREADPRDARAGNALLTPAGQQLLIDATATANEVAERLLRRLSVGQTRQLERLLGEVTSAPRR